MKSFLLVFFIVGLLLMFGLPAQAQLNQAGNKLSAAVKGTGLESFGSGEAGLSTVIGSVVKAALSLVGTVFLLLTIYAGILWMTAQGKEDQIETAKKIITAAIIGLFITMAAYTITFFVTSRLSGVGQGTAAPAGAPAQGGGGGLTDDQCNKQGGKCDYLTTVGETCDPKGVDVYNGSTPDHCTTDANTNQPRICCLLKNNEDKCALAGGTCQKDPCKVLLPNLNQIDAGFACEEGHTPDWYCCKNAK